MDNSFASCEDLDDCDNVTVHAPVVARAGTTHLQRMNERRPRKRQRGSDWAIWSTQWQAAWMAPAAAFYSPVSCARRRGDRAVRAVRGVRGVRGVRAGGL